MAEKHINESLKNLRDATIIKRHGEVKNQQLKIDNCKKTVLIFLDNSPSVTVDDCRDCLIILGPCSGSVFIRDSHDCTIFVMCQQLRCRDSSNLTISVYCTTEPVVEDVIATITKWNLDYPHLKEQSNNAGFQARPNCYQKVHDFTPETSKISVSTLVPAFEFNFLPNLNIEEIFKTEQITFIE